MSDNAISIRIAIIDEFSAGLKGIEDELSNFVSLAQNGVSKLQEEISELKDSIDSLNGSVQGFASANRQVDFLRFKDLNAPLDQLNDKIDQLNTSVADLKTSPA